MTLFESVVYFAHNASDPLSWPISSSKDLEKEIISKLL